MRAVARLGLAVCLGLAGAAALAAWIGWQLYRPYKGYPGSEIRIDVPYDRGAGSILDELQASGVLASSLAARLYLVYGLGSPPLKAGEYRFSGPATTPEVLDKLIRGAVLTHPLTLIEGLDLDEVAASIAAAGFGSRQELRRLMADPALISDVDPDAPDLEGYLFPDTYHFAQGTAPARIVETLVRTFRRNFERHVRPLLAEDASVRAVVTLASIVEKEARLDAERPLIAGVYRNRLRRGMGLYADPTVIYALKRAGRWDGNIRRRDLKLESPYNTYVHVGLPPGPICSPGLASLEAAAAPSETPHLYFVSRNDGSHAFSSTLAEHNRNVEKWQRRYWQERWARERMRETQP